MERLTKTEARRDGTYDGYQRIIDGHLSHGVHTEQLVVEGKPDGRNGDKQNQTDHTEHIDIGQRTAKNESRDDEQQAADGEAVTSTDEHIHPSAQSTSHQIGRSTTDGIKDNHTIAQKGTLDACDASLCEEVSAFGPTEVQSQDAAETYHTANQLPRCQAVALETGTSQQHHKERTQRVEDGSPRTFAMRHSYVEEEIVERGVHQRKGKDESPVDESLRLKRPPVATRNSQDYQSCHRKADAGEEHLAASHVGRDTKSVKTHFDKWECPAPCYRGCQRKRYYPCGALKYGCPRFFHLIR